ncbi:MAG: beta-ketoacyl-ACP synthase II [Polyangiaceae bacterium]|nr:beta-ketoacyl-ACP synthase II [Polyangiaceae bacterium]
MERVVVTGIGMLSPCGHGARESWHAVLEGHSGVGPISQFDAAAYPVRIAGEVKGFDPLAYMGKARVKEMGRFAQLSIAASQKCLADSGLELTDELRDQCGTFIGVGLGGIEFLYKHAVTLNDKGPSKVSPYFIPCVIGNLAAGQVAIDLGLRGPSYCTTSACASSAHAIGDACDWIRLGRTPVMLAGGAEATITGLGIAGFAAMFALSRRNDEPAKASRPWDRDRDGFVCAEGAVSLLLESLTHARARGARIYAEVTGYGASCDAYHVTKPSGEGAVKAMRQALGDARLDPTDVDYVNAHGTSTPQGDLEEAKAVQTLFGDHALSGRLWMSSTKGATGHLLGAAGAIEAAFCALALADGKVPPTLNLENQDPEVLVDCVPHTARDRPLRHAMSNSFGFGGTNATLVLSRYEG